MVCYSILWITGVWKWRTVGGGEDRRYINMVKGCGCNQGTRKMNKKRADPPSIKAAHKFKAIKVRT
jgi:hypothetical protein